MSSGLQQVPGMARKVFKKFANTIAPGVETLGLTPRQQELNHLWSWYCTCRYDARKVDWDGSERVERLDAEAIATAGVLPGGFYIAGADFPLKFRRPSAPYPLARVIVNRFTGLLFSESQHPQIRCVGDPDLEDYVGALADYSRLWAAMILARTFGGATGTYCMTYKFVKGKPIIEVHDPRYVTPIFTNPETRELESIEKRWMWPEHHMNEKREWETEYFWTRRLIDDEVDVQWNKVAVDPEGREPDWMSLEPDHYVQHDNGEFPGVWGQNIPVVDHEDGEPDCLGVYDMIEEMDMLIAQATIATKKNLDPTMLIKSRQKLAELRKGSDNAVKLEPDGDARYLEMTGSGQAEAFKEALQLRNFILESAQCVLDHSDETSQETATLSRMRYASMTSKADILREQYGQKGVLPLVEKMVRSVRQLQKSKPGENGQMVRQTVVLPPREITKDDGTKDYEDRVLPEENTQRGQFTLQWPPYFKPTLQDANQAASAVKTAKDSLAVSDETAARFLAPYLDVEDVPAELLKIKAERKEHEEEAKVRAEASWGGK